jgi:murein DD-endopeptidase MepM/ murein hydrolase activator NlpD
VVEFQLPKLTARVRFPLPAPCWLQRFGIVLSVLLIAGCASAPKTEPPVTPPAPPVAEKPKGIYHKVSKQESLWRIAKTYNVTVDEIIKANNIPNAAVIEENQLILIPGALEPRKVITEKAGEAKSDDEFAWPLRGRVISYFNDAKGRHVNRGIDIMAATGEEVKAARDGRVVMADYLNGYGYTVILDHQDGFYSVYAHTSELLVKLNDLVARGTPLGRVGQSGRNAFLHFEVRKFEQANNPLYYLP